jgi:hypothetical protein
MNRKVNMKIHIAKIIWDIDNPPNLPSKVIVTNAYKWEDGDLAETLTEQYRHPVLGFEWSEDIEIIDEIGVIK